MKTLKLKSIFFSLMAVMALSVLMISCEQEPLGIVIDELDGIRPAETHDVNGTIESVDDEFAALLAESSKQEMTIEYATLDEINHKMLEYGLQPFTEEDVETVERGVFPCSTWEFFGDWTNDGVLNTLDVIYAEQYLCQNGGCNGSVTINYSSAPYGATKFKSLSYLMYSNGGGILNRTDINIARSYVLGRIDCN